MELNKALFWDVHMDSLDKEKHARFIIGRVVSRGNCTDWTQLTSIYGLDRMKQEVVSIRSLDRKTLNFLSVYFDLEKTDFRCCS